MSIAKTDFKNLPETTVHKKNNEYSPGFELGISQSQNAIYFKANKWCLVDCFHHKFRVSTQILVHNYCIVNYEMIFWTLFSDFFNNKHKDFRIIFRHRKFTT